MNGEEKVYNLIRANMFLHYMTFSEREIFFFFSFPSKKLLIPFDLLTFEGRGVSFSRN